MMNTENGQPNWLDALIDDLVPVVPYVGQWVLNYCVDMGVVLVHPLAQAMRGQQKRSGFTVALQAFITLVRYPVQLMLTVGSLILNAVSSLINNVLIQSHERSLTQEELQYLKPIFGNSVDYKAVRLQFGGVKEALGISPQAVGGDIFIRQFWGDHAVNPDTTLTASGMRLLGHEVAHVWQYQNLGAGYIGDSLMTQVLDVVGRIIDLHLSDGYDLRVALKDKRAVNDWNVEQQAVMAELIGVSCHADKAGSLTLKSFNRVSGFKLTEEEFGLVREAHLWFGRAR